MPQQAPPVPPLPGHRRRKSNRKRNAILIGVAGIFVIGVIAAALGNGKPAKPAASSPTASATVAASSPAVARKPSFPPKTLVDFRAFAATGDASQVHQIATSTEGLPSCPNPNIYVAVSQGLTGRALEADLAAFFVQSGLVGNQCQASVFAFHSESDYQAHQNDGYTAGRVALTTNSGSGPQHNLEVDAGDVTNMQAAKFDFNF
jgi:hypothetical protein